MRRNLEHGGTVWTPAHIEELKGLAASGVPTSMIALHLGRSVIAIRSKAAALNLKVSETGRETTRQKARQPSPPTSI